MTSTPKRIILRDQAYVLAQEPARKLSPDEYHMVHEKCPIGFRWDGKHCHKEEEKKPVLKVVSPSAPKKIGPTPETHPRLFTKSGRRLFMQPSPKAKLVINPNYDEKKDDTYYCKSVRLVNGKKMVARHYSRDFVVRNKRQKFANNHFLANKLPDIQKGYAKDLGSEDSDIKYHALAIALADQALFRIGNPASEKEREVRGLHNLTVGNVKLGPKGEVTFEYKGKHAVVQRHVILDKKLTRLVKELVTDKEPNDYLFSWKKDNKVKHASPESLNGYFKDTLGSPVSLHKLRTFHATRMAKEVLDEPIPEEIKANPKKFLKYFREKMLPISQKLGHTSITTTLNHYVDPTVVEDFFNRNKQEMPKTILASLQKTAAMTIQRKGKTFFVVTSKPSSRGIKQFSSWMNKVKLPNRPPKRWPGRKQGK